jgi:PhnB protein
MVCSAYPGITNNLYYIYMSAIPYLIVRDAVNAIEFYKHVFDATEVVRLADSNGKVMHAEIKICDSQIMLADEFPDMGYRSPTMIGGSSVSILIYVEDVDKVFASGISAGANPTMPVQDQFDGDRRGTFTDPFGHIWLVATRKEEISIDELRKRFESMLKQ